MKVLPAWIAMRPGAPTNLTARVKGVPVDGVAWSVQEGAAGGSVDTAGRYTAPLAPGVYHVIGTNLYDPTKRAVVEVHVSASAGAYVTITPYVTQLGQGGTRQFAATVSNAANTAVIWSCNGGSIDATTGLYTAPNAYGNYTVTATSVEDTNASDTASVIVSSGTGADKVFTYDLNGNMTSDGTRSFEWDAENRLVAVVKGTHRSEFGYDGFGHRVEIRELDADANGNWVSSTDTKYVWEGAEIIESRTADGSTSLQRYYAQGFMDSDGTALYYTRDHEGSVRELVDAFGAIRARYDYDPYGRMTQLSGDRSSLFGYIGLVWHAPSGLMLSLFRSYDPAL
ncbi:MAG: hypothetical protein JST24_10355, partial [Acidobacteria bacterium]|nr:hypothetical protein [Acidobacteriota bacterium]